MAENEEGATPPTDETVETPVDPIQNLKAEFARKTDNLMQQTAETNRRLNEALALLAQSRPAAPKPPEEDIVAAAVNDPARFADIVVNRALSAVDSRVTQQNQRASEAQQAVAALSNDYPELANQGSELARLATSIHQNLPESQRGSGMAVRAAIREAAAELGVLPVSKRKPSSNDESFTLGNAGGGSSGSKPRAPKEAEVDPKTLAVLELMGHKPDDAMKKELARISKRNFGRFKGRG